MHRLLWDFSEFGLCVHTYPHVGALVVFRKLVFNYVLCCMCVRVCPVVLLATLLPQYSKGQVGDSSGPLPGAFLEKTSS